MRSTLRLSATIACLFFLFVTGHSSPAVDEPVAIEILTESQNGFTVALDFQTPTLVANRHAGGDVSLRVDLPGAIPEFEAGVPVLPAISKLVVVPDGYSVRVHIKDMHEVRYDLQAYLSRDEMYNRSLRQVSQLPAVEVGEPGWMRWLRVAPVVIRPAHYEAAGHRIACADRMEIEFEFVPDGSSTGNAPDPERYWSQAFERTKIDGLGAYKPHVTADP